jgi:hypothetical protein
MSESIARAADLETLLNQVGAVSSRLVRADRSALARIKTVEKALLKRAPRLEVWTAPLLQDSAEPPQGTTAKARVRTVSLGFAPVPRLPQLEAWLEAAQLPVGKRWGLVVREEYRTEGGKSASQRVLRLSRAELSLRVALVPHLDALVRAIHEEVCSRVERLPAELLSDSTKPVAEKEAATEAAPAGAEPAPA